MKGGLKRLAPPPSLQRRAAEPREECYEKETKTGIVTASGAEVKVDARKSVIPIQI